MALEKNFWIYFFKGDLAYNLKAEESSAFFLFVLKEIQG